MSEILLEMIRKLEPDGTDFTVNLPLISSSTGKFYYAKVGRTDEKEQYTGEIQSLEHINSGAPGLAPKVLSSGEDDGRPLFISEYKHLSSLTKTSADRLAQRLATELHAHVSSEGFGFPVPTFCGRTRQNNGWYNTWEECYDALIGGLLDGLSRRASNEALCQKGQQIRRSVIPFLLRNLDVQPVILHGDLWSGNVGTDKSTGEPIIFDPSSYYGHNEADLSIARIFGGFPESFFETYHTYLPKSDPVDQYELRVDLYELYHYLNHALLFGGGVYASSSLQKMDRLLRYCTPPA